MSTVKEKSKPFVAVKNRAYKLMRSSPLSYSLASRDTRNYRLLHYDGERERPIRYARNQRSPYVDEQDDNAILDQIIFIDGMLTVPKENSVLQWFLEIHPLNGKVFVAIDKEKDAASEVEKFDMEADAIIAARNLSAEEMYLVARLIINKSHLLSSHELKRDIRLFAKTYPARFLEILADPQLNYLSEVALFFENGLLGTRNNDRDVYFNLPNNKARLLVLPPGQNKTDATAAFLKTNEGIESYKMLKVYLEKELK